MIDTIVLLLNKDQYSISNPDKFARGFINPTKKELLAGIYKPRLTFMHHNVNTNSMSLKIELSLPKLLFGNNFDELKAKDFVVVLQKLTEVLKIMGVITNVQTLSRIPVSGIHYSKNIPLTDGSTPYHYINKIKEANIKLSLDINQTDYRNEGHCYKWHSNSYEVVFYDKIRDLEKAKLSSKRALEKDNALQLNFLNRFEKRKKLEILRMEVRLNKRQKIKQLFKILQIKSDLTFKSLFKPAISKKILLYYLDEIESRRPLLIDYKTSSDKALLVTLILNNPDLGPKQILQLYGLKQALNIMNPRELRTMFAKYNSRGWYRLIADAAKVVLPGIESSLGLIRKHIIKFKLTRF